MVRIAGIDLPNSKRLEIALTHIYGIGRSISKQIIAETGVDPDLRVHQMSDEDVNRVRRILETKGDPIGANPYLLEAADLYRLSKFVESAKAIELVLKDQ